MGCGCSAGETPAAPCLPLALRRRNKVLPAGTPGDFEGVTTARGPEGTTTAATAGLVPWDPRLSPAGRVPIPRLPAPALALLCRCLDAAALANALRVSRDWQRALGHDGAWRTAAAEVYPPEVLRRAVAAAVPLRRLCVAAVPIHRNLLRGATATDLPDHQRWWRICGQAALTSKVLAVEERRAGTRCWVTTHTKVRRKQTVNLEALGFPLSWLDGPDPPPLHVAAWHAGAPGAAVFRLKVQLLGAWAGGGLPQAVLDQFDSGERRSEGDDPHRWHEVATCFQKYPKGLRYISFEDASMHCAVAHPYVGFFEAPPPLPAL